MFFNIGEIIKYVSNFKDIMDDSKYKIGLILGKKENFDYSGFNINCFYIIYNDTEKILVADNLIKKVEW